MNADDIVRAVRSLAEGKHDNGLVMMAGKKVVLNCAANLIESLQAQLTEEKEINRKLSDGTADLIIARDALQTQLATAYTDGVKKAVYEIMKEADIPGSREIRESGDTDDCMCAQVADRIRAQLELSRERERAAVHDIELVLNGAGVCHICANGDCSNCLGADGCEPIWRGPVAGEGEKE